ncbi:MAG: hypothetical protein R3Y08_04195 [Rikenellaceae bacterium]
MKKFLKLFAIALIGFAAVACDKEDNQEPIEEQLTINYRNMRGVWSLTSLEGQQLEGDVYFYINFMLEDDIQKFVSYTNFNSAFSSMSEGVYTIEQNEDMEMIISGVYYNQFQAPWDSDYIVTGFTSTEMEWRDTVSGESRTYVRVDEIPEDILSGTRAL